MGLTLYKKYWIGARSWCRRSEDVKKYQELITMALLLTTFFKAF